MSVPAVPVAILAYGYSNPWSKSVDKRIAMVGDSGVATHLEDMARLLPHDPAYNEGAPRARWQENAMFENTVVAVMANTEYGNVATAVFRDTVHDLPPRMVQESLLDSSLRSGAKRATTAQV